MKPWQAWSTAPLASVSVRLLSRGSRRWCIEKELGRQVALILGVSEQSGFKEYVDHMK